MIIDNDSLKLFHPLINKWFIEKYGLPTEIQLLSWAQISNNENVLLISPTGSGKTLAAFLWAINQLITGLWAVKKTSILYISPLKSLNNDIKINLINPLKELQLYFTNNGEYFPQINVQTRSGDTPQNERRRMLRVPPEILITTPESLNLIISSIKARRLLTDLKTVVLDEIHAVANNKRGTYLITAVDRLVLLSGEFQRICLSATISKPELLADFVAGYRMENNDKEIVYNKRSIKIVKSRSSKNYDVQVLFPKRDENYIKENSRWSSLISEFVKIINNKKSILFFTNNRKLTEKITRLINNEQKQIVAYSHHGSLSKEIRTYVEQKLKKGELKAIVATSTLELGIDIGNLDEVVLIQSPNSVTVGLQRIGRAGHSVRKISQAKIFPIHKRDLINCAVIAKAIKEGEIEETYIPECPLDILSQVIVSMVGVEQWDKDTLYKALRSSYPFHKLTQLQYDTVLEMLAGRYEDSKIRELKARISIDKIDNTINGKDGVLRILYLAGGTIPDRGYYALRLYDTKEKIGELDEEFVWERNIGDIFTLGTQSWKIKKIDHQNVDVIFVKKSDAIFPFWKADHLKRNFFLSEKIGLFLKEWNKRLEENNSISSLKEEYYLEKNAAIQLIEFLKKQKKATNSDLPHRHLLLIEHLTVPLNRIDTKPIILHTLWGSTLNLPFSIALSQAWEEKYHLPLQVFEENDCIIFNLPNQCLVREIFNLVTPENIQNLLRKKLEKTGFFGAHFRENAARALLLPKQEFNKRMPLWLNRLRSKKLFNTIIKYKDFPILLETWRECLKDEFDLTNLIKVLEEIQQGIISIKEIFTKIPSPFTTNVIWRQTNKFIYEDDTPTESKISNLRKDIIKDLIFDQKKLPRISNEVIQEFTDKIQRTYPGYAPTTPSSLLDLIKERIIISETEWNKLLDSIGNDLQAHSESVLEPIKEKIHKTQFTEIGMSAIVSLEKLSRLERALGNEKDLFTIFIDWIQFYGPISKLWAQRVWGLNDRMMNDLIENFIKQEIIVVGYLSEKAEETEFCDSTNYEILLRMARKKRRPDFEPLDISYLPLFIAEVQGLTSPGNSEKNMQYYLETLWGYTTPANLWETEIFPARLNPYYPSWLDALFFDNELIWFGCGKEKIGFCFDDDFELFQSKTLKKNDENLKLFQDKNGKYNFWDLSTINKLPSNILTEKLWEMVWQGLISNDKIQVLRKAIENKFKVTNFHEFSKGKAIRYRTSFNRWKSNRPITGNWFIIKKPEKSEDLLEQGEVIKDRIRMLFKRYGVLFKEILSNEIKELQWAAIFRTLRLMELSGEILAGYFFKGISGIQFISYSSYQKIKKKLSEDPIYWMNAADPASLSGLKIEGIKTQFPSRRSSNHIIIHGKKIVIISMQNWKNLLFKISPNDPNIKNYLKIFKIQLNRRFKPLKKIKVEIINGELSTKSPYKDALIDFGFKPDYKALVLW